jgi:hypothetical protein
MHKPFRLSRHFPTKTEVKTMSLPLIAPPAESAPKPKLYLRRFLTVLSMFIIIGIPVLPVFAQQRAIANPSIEQPVIPSDYLQINADSVPGWLTTHPVDPTRGRMIEIWRNGFNGINTATGAGHQFVELNAEARSMIYQQICMTNGESFSYSFLHRGRASATNPDVAEFRLGIPSGLPAGSVGADAYSYPIVRVSTTNNGTQGAAPTGNGTINPSVLVNGWRRYSGTYTYSGQTRMVNIGFVAISTALGNVTVGNFLDQWQIQLAPYLEFSASSDSGFEGTGGTNTPANRPGIRISGNVTSNVTLTVAYTGGTATLGEDFSMTVPYQYGNTTSSAVITIPPGTYDGISESSIFRIPFSVATDMSLEADETANFQVTNVTGATVANLTTCTAAPIQTMSYTILNDDLTTAGGVNLTGRVIGPDGRGIGHALVTITTGDGEQRTAISNHFGYYRFLDITAGDFVILSVTAKNRSFISPTMAFIINEDLAQVDFIAD